MIFVRQLFALLLVLTMVATTGSMAMMRDRDAGAHAMVICTGVGMQTILVDANGDKVEPAPMCPDCTMVLLANGPAAPELVVQLPARRLEVALSATSQAYVREGSSTLKARAPPVG